MARQTSNPYEAYGINPTYDYPDAYGVAGSHFGKGRYPPDWSQRREAVWERQQYWCGRCKRYKGDLPHNQVHHVQHLADGGSNHLANLVGLCGDCHALMHPEVSAIEGVAADASLYPDDNADDRVAVIRKPRGNDKLEHDLDRVEELSSPDDNHHAVTQATLKTNARTARRAEADLAPMLTANGYVPRTIDYHRIRVVPFFGGYRGLFTSYRPDIAVTTDGSCYETDWSDSNHQYDVLCTRHASNTTVELTDGTGEAKQRQITFPRFPHEDGERLRAEVPVTPPPITIRTAPRYVFDAITYFGWKSFKWGLLPGLAIALLVPEAVPFADPTLQALGFGVLAVVVLGLVLRLPWMAWNLHKKPAERVIDTRRTETD